MTITVNGNPHEMPEGVTVQQLLQTLGFTQHAYAVALNLEFIPRADHGATVLKQGDQVEIVAPRQGG